MSEETLNSRSNLIEEAKQLGVSRIDALSMGNEELKKKIFESKTQDISDIEPINISKSAQLRRQKGGKMISKHQLETIHANQDFIRNNLQTPQAAEQQAPALEAAELSKLREELHELELGLASEINYPCDNPKVKESFYSKIAAIQAQLNPNSKGVDAATLVNEPVPAVEPETQTASFIQEKINMLNVKFVSWMHDRTTKSAERLQRLRDKVNENDPKTIQALRKAQIAAVGAAGTMAGVFFFVQTARAAGTEAVDAIGLEAFGLGPTGSTGATSETGSTDAMGEVDPTEATGEQKIDPEDKIDTEQSTSGNTDSDGNYNRTELHTRDRMSTEGAFDGTERTAAELDDHVLAKIKNNPSLMSAVLEVRESGNKDANFSLADVNSDTGQFPVHGENGEYSAKGEKAVDTLERSWDRGSQGELLSKSEVSKIMDKYEFINHGTDNGDFKNAIDDRMYDAGKFDYRPDLGDEIYKKKLGNGETVYFKVNEPDPTRDCLNVQTLREKGSTTLSVSNPDASETIDESTIRVDLDGTPTTTDQDVDKNPKEDINANTNLNEQLKMDDDRVPAGDQKPATQPGPTYTAPNPPQTPEVARPTSPPTVETGAPTQNNPANGTVTQP